MQPTAQNVTPEAEALAAVAAKIKSEKLLKFQQELYIDYMAVGGLILNDDGSFKKSERNFDGNGVPRNYSITDFATDLGVSRKTLWTWQKLIPDFWNRVSARRLELGSQARTAKVWNGVFLRASKGDAEQAKIWLSRFDNWQPPSQKHEVRLDGVVDVVQVARLRREQPGKVIEGEGRVVDEPSTTTNT